MIAFGFLFSMGAGVHAQEIIAPPPPEFSQKAQVAPPAEPVATNNTEQVSTETTLSSPISSGPAGLLDWGQIHLRPHVFYRVSSGDGLPSAPGQTVKTVINEVDPGLTVTLGNHWQLDYTPTLRFYSSRGFRDELNHAVILSGSTAYDEWVFGFSQSYSASSSPLIETAGQTDQETYSTAVNASYPLNSKVSLNLGLSQNIRFVGASVANETLTDSRSWSLTAGVNYSIWPGLSAGVTAAVGYDNLTIGSDMISETLQGRLYWRPGRRLSFSLYAGFEDRQFLQSSISSSPSPIFGCDLAYQIFEPTVFTLAASRAVSASYFGNELTASTSFSASLRQRLLKRLYLDLSGSYGTTDYQTTSQSFSVNRSDNHTSLDARLTFPFHQHGTVSAFYDRSENSSNDTLFKYASTQTGLEIGYRF
jgi:hypothetical protein